MIFSKICDGKKGLKLETYGIINDAKQCSKLFSSGILEYLRLGTSFNMFNLNMRKACNRWKNLNYILQQQIYDYYSYRLHECMKSVRKYC